MVYFILSALVVIAGFGVERFYLRRRFGPFALLFWIFVLQIAVLGTSWLLNARGIEPSGIAGDALMMLAGLSYLTIGLVPIAGLLVAMFTLLVGGAACRRADTKGRS
jgi:hypothetical protein